MNNTYCTTYLATFTDAWKHGVHGRKEMGAQSGGCLPLIDVYATFLFPIELQANTTIAAYEGLIRHFLGQGLLGLWLIV
jgi:hypothetical protein